jgi:hypothetical protein
VRLPPPLLRPAAQPPRRRLTSGSTTAIFVLASGSITAALASPSCRLHPDQQLDRRRLRLGQRLDDCRHHLFVGGLEPPFACCLRLTSQPAARPPPPPRLGPRLDR